MEPNRMVVVMAVCFFVVCPRADAQEGASAAADPPSDTGSPRRFGISIAPVDDPLVTDRPDFTESTDAVPLGRVQIEMGYTFSYDREDNVRTRVQSTPEFLLRMGLSKDFEIRLGWEGYEWSDTGFPSQTRAGRSIRRKEHDQGAYDSSLGFKRKFCEQDGWRPHFGVIGEVSVPSGSNGVSSGDVEPGVVLLWAYDVGDRLAVAGNVGLFAPLDAGNRFVQASASLSAAFALTDRIGSYVEYFGLYPNAEETDAAHSINGGFTYLMTNNFQLDWRIGFGVNEEADDFFTGLGFAWRF